MNAPLNEESFQNWMKIKLKLKESVDPENYARWIEPLKVKNTDESNVFLDTPNQLFDEVIFQNYRTKIDYCKDLLGLDNLHIRFESHNTGHTEDNFSRRITGNTEDNQAYTNGSSQQITDKVTAPKFSAPGGLGLDTAQLYESNNQQQNLNNFNGNSHTSHTNSEASAANSSGKNQENLLNSGNGGVSNTRSREKCRALNKSFHFHNFVKGPSNQFALATCENVADNPGKSYNPLFLYGSTGLGKTHLLHSIGNRVLETFPNAVVAYITSEDFTNELIISLRHNKMTEFRQKYRSCDVFLIDDIQFITKKRATQEEFFHTFNTLYEAKKQIVFTSDKFPQEIPEIDERLRNRFQWGLIADIQPPDFEHRVAILLSKAEKLQISLNYEVAEFIASKAKKNIRVLEGALHRIKAHADLQGSPIDLKLARETFQNILPEPVNQLNIETVQQSVAQYFKVKVADLKSKKRHRSVTLPRQIAMFLSKELTKSSYPEIGNKFGGKDHSTVMHACNKIRKEKDTSVDLRVHLESLQRIIEQQG